MHINFRPRPFDDEIFPSAVSLRSTVNFFSPLPGVSVGFSLGVCLLSRAPLHTPPYVYIYIYKVVVIHVDAIHPAGGSNETLGPGEGPRNFPFSFGECCVRGPLIFRRGASVNGRCERTGGRMFASRTAFRSSVGNFIGPAIL